MSEFYPTSPPNATQLMLSFNLEKFFRPKSWAFAVKAR
jgi:hypothetical protein